MTQQATTAEPKVKVGQLTLSKETLRQLAADESREARNPANGCKTLDSCFVTCGRCSWPHYCL